MNTKINVHSKIRQIRESKNYSQEYMALKLGISQNAYSKTELGHTTITLERLYEIAKILELNILDIIGSEEKRTNY
ncbi:helix-turn-helix domain-containing protein [Solitalea koreensis]|uniref:DNA-binding transcriptional regulator, XRE-family HTH domain n=1 Tax=Solitalea koreensis TaxID=543615 RepID=A0A521CS59_9SPHI|nr:helix-turn-helix transcriptional regulator [Solitalea koreensis]SMO62307.1 DNA-binding transcriptional regulator, XRE-family HTH domain [Solitalea koreensis]